MRSCHVNTVQYTLTKITLSTTKKNIKTFYKTVCIKIFLLVEATTISSTTNHISTPSLMNNNINGGGGENGGLTQCVAIYDCIGNPQQNKLKFCIYDLVDDVDY